ncbi:MAG: 16S rRNA (cytosine(1402)-N(4))-methyltransferase RsmH [Erysipelothrix sp.]|nr:16S rRNA (cytosine(1402)-N(4))-methyltransferase RsmH [Erysipelothrix sp.]
MTAHISVLLNEAIEGLNIKSDGVYVDGTLGRGGHSREILKQLEKGILYSFDKDQTAIDAIENNTSNWRLIKDDFKNIKDRLELEGISKIDGLLLDIGVSSPQFDQGERGFSYRFDDKLDMRMDLSQKLNAYIVVNKYPEEELIDVFYKYGEERYAPAIAKNIVLARKEKPVETTFELVDIIKSSLPQRELRKKGHPAKQVFQAIRIEVNDELRALEKVLDDASKMLKSGGRIVVISFHSLEDRIVKQTFKKLEDKNKLDPRIPIMPDQIMESDFKVITRRPITASEAELLENKRAASAKLRIIERI